MKARPTEKMATHTHDRLSCNIKANVAIEINAIVLCFMIYIILNNLLIDFHHHTHSLSQLLLSHVLPPSFITCYVPLLYIIPSAVSHICLSLGTILKYLPLMSIVLFLFQKTNYLVFFGRPMILYISSFVMIKPNHCKILVCSIHFPF